MARLEWGPNSTLGQAIIGKVRTVLTHVYFLDIQRIFPRQSAIPMTDLVRSDPRNMVSDPGVIALRIKMADS